MNDLSNTAFTGADLRRARRKARRLGLSAANGKQAIKLLLERGIDIKTEEITAEEAARVGNIQNTRPAETPQHPVRAADGEPQQITHSERGGLLIKNEAPSQLPIQRTAAANTPAVITQEQRLAEVAKLEAKIKKRRESKLRALFRRLAIYVVIPTASVWAYFFFFATPYYAAETAMKVEAPILPGTTGGQSSLFGGVLGDQSEPIAIQGYLQSRQAFQKLQDRYDFTAIYQQEGIDRFRKLTPESPLEQQYGVYRDQIRVTYDNTDQALRMEVRSPDPQSAIDISEVLIDLAEENLDATSRVVREASVRDAEEVVKIKADIIESLKSYMLTLQSEQQSLDATADKEIQVGIIGDLEAQKSQYQQQLNTLLANAQPNEARVNGLEEQIALVERQITAITEAATTPADGTQSTAQLDLAMQFAQADLLAAQRSYQLAAEGLQLAQTQMRTQRKYLATSLTPTATFEPKYPKVFLNTFAAFLVFFGLYIFVSITVEVIREQVSA